MEEEKGKGTRSRRRQALSGETELWLMLAGRTDGKGRPIVPKELTAEEERMRRECLSKVLFLYKEDCLPRWTLMLLTLRLGLDGGDRVTFRAISEALCISTIRLSRCFVTTLEDLRCLLAIGELFEEMPAGSCKPIWPSRKKLRPTTDIPLYNRKEHTWFLWDFTNRRWFKYDNPADWLELRAYNEAMRYFQDRFERKPWPRIPLGNLTGDQ